MIYVQWKKGESRRGKMFEPLGIENARDDIASMQCPFCQYPIGNMKRYGLLIVGPMPDDEEALAKYETDRWHNAGAAVMHEACFGYLTDAGLEWLVGELTVKEPRDPQ